MTIAFDLTLKTFLFCNSQWLAGTPVIWNLVLLTHDALPAA
jgi:hypothetical protein